MQSRTHAVTHACTHAGSHVFKHKWKFESYKSIHVLISLVLVQCTLLNCVLQYTHMFKFIHCLNFTTRSKGSSSCTNSTWKRTVYGYKDNGLTHACTHTGSHVFKHKWKFEIYKSIHVSISLLPVQCTQLNRVLQYTHMFLFIHCLNFTTRSKGSSSCRNSTWKMTVYGYNDNGHWYPKPYKCPCLTVF